MFAPEFQKKEHRIDFEFIEVFGVFCYENNNYLSTKLYLNGLKSFDDSKINY